MKFFLITVLALAATISASSDFECPPKDGQYEHPEQCDKYYECEDGVAKEKLCPDGLVFDPFIRKINKCDHPFNVDCGDRNLLQEPKPKGPCPRRNGFFAHEDPAVCNKFINCIEGEYTEISCTNGLHFDELSGTCVWPDDAGRHGCNEVVKTLEDGFKCPSEVQIDSNGNLIVHPTFAHPTDCQKYYICLNGQEPRILGCQIGEVYNEESQKCDDPANVQGCEDWFVDEEPEVVVVPAKPSKPLRKA